MAPPKRYWVKINMSQKFLKTLPEFLPPISKSRLKKIAAEERKAASSSIASAAGSKVSSPAPENGTSANNASSSGNPKINSGMKESSTSGLVVNSINNSYSLDKSGKPCRKWIKKPREFKTFSGFKVEYISWRHEQEKGSHPINSVKEEMESVPISASATPDVRLEA